MQAIKQVFMANDGKIFYGEHAREDCEAYERELFARKRREALAAIGYKEIDIADAYKDVYDKRNYAVLCVARPECEDDFTSIINLLLQYWHPHGLNEIARAIPKCPCDVNFIVYQASKNMHVQVVQSEVAARFTDHTVTRAEKELAIQEAIAPEVREKKRFGKEPLVLELNGKTNSLRGWARELGMNASVLSQRMKRGMTFQQAVECDKHYVPPVVEKKRVGGKSPKLYTHNGETKNMSEWARQFGINPATLNSRLTRGVPFDKAVNPGRLNAANA